MEDRFEDAAAMEGALTAAMRGVAPEQAPAHEDTAATRMLDRTSVTTPLERTQPAAARRRRMEPIAEPPRRQPPRPARAAPAPAPAARRKRPGGLLRALRTLLIVAVLAGVAVTAYVLADESGRRGVQLKERVEGNVQKAVDEIETLIEDNTR